MKKDAELRWMSRLVRLVETIELTAEQEEDHALAMRDFSPMQEAKALSRAMAYKTAASMIREEFSLPNAGSKASPE